MGKKISTSLKKELRAEAKSRARQYRRELGLGEEPILDIFDLIERQGVILVRYPSPSDKLSALIAKDTDNYYIYINSDMSLGHQIFSGSHELYHYRYDKDNLQVIACKPLTKQEDPSELMADYFAGEFLMPEDTVIAFWKRFGRIHRIEPRHVIIMACSFRVSFTAMLYTLLRLKLIGGPVYGGLKKLSNPENKELLQKWYEWSGYTTELIEPTRMELPKAFIEAATSNYVSGKVSYKKIESLLKPWMKKPEDLGIEYDYGID